ncbi:MAG: hypothetical protein KF800_07270 [Lysobacter sp.]|nr:hypothetical protein [Lysobacter sp.]
MMSLLPKPPWPLALPASGYLLLEAWFWRSVPGTPATLRFLAVFLLVAGVLYENRFVLPLWALYCLFGALIFTTWSLRAVRTDATEAAVFAACAAMALTQVVYLFFFHSPRRSRPLGDA